jgi:hypothetical protein
MKELKIEPIINAMAELYLRLASQGQAMGAVAFQFEGQTTRRRLAVRCS